MPTSNWSVRALAVTLLTASICFYSIPAANAAANAVPLVNQPLVPSTAEPGSHGITITVNGAGFVSNSVVNWNGTPLSTSFVKIDQLQATVPDADVASAGTASITVTNPAPGGGTSNPASFTVTTPTTSVGFSSSVHSVPVDPSSVITADFNGDGLADLAMFGQSSSDCNAISGAIAIMLGNGHGGFTKKSVICVEAVSQVYGVAGDFNNDGKMDLAVVAADCGGCAGLTIFLGNGDGTFIQAADPIVFQGALLAITTGDFNGDGNLDLAVSFLGEPLPDFAILLGNGDGTFPSGLGNNLGPDIVTSYSLTVGDFNDDGILDLASVGSGTFDGQELAPLSIFLGKGDGTFTLGPSQPSLAPTYPLIAADFTGDGILDLVNVGPTIAKGNGDGTFTQLPSTVSFEGTLIGVADFNGDGKLDVAYLNSSNIITIYFGNGDGTFQPGLSQPVENVGVQGGVSYLSAAIADFNGDGHADIAMGDVILKQAEVPLRPAITLSSGQNPSTLNQSVTFTAVVAAGLTGSVTFKEGSTVLGTVPVSNGQASLPVTFAKPGSFSVTAVLYENQKGGPKYSSAVQIVNKYPTGTDLSVNGDYNQGQRVTFTASVGSEGGPAPTGSVTFKDGNITLGRATLVNGVATLIVSHLPLPGDQPSLAIYNGNAVSETSVSNPYPFPENY